MRAALLLVAVGLISAGCSSAYDSADKQACMLLAQAQCKKVDQCVHNGVVNRYGNETTCETLLTAQCKARFEASHTGERSTGISACVAALSGASCSDFEGNTIDACEPLTGTAAAGAACAFSTQCASSFCALATNGNCGTCAPLSNEHDDCTAHVCSPGFVCVATTMTCEPPSASGEPCSADEPCGLALTCVTASGATTGMCEPSGETAGTACDPQHETAPGCDVQAGLTCAASTKTCIALTYATAGAACGDVSGTTVDCEMKSTCFGDSGTTPGLCVAFAAVGAACNTSTGPDCAPPAMCVTGSPTNTAGTCAVLDAAACK